MATAREPEAGLFFAGVLAADDAASLVARDALAERWGKPELDGGPWPFSVHTRYYEAEAGPAMVRRFFAFPGAFSPGELANRKTEANALEIELAERIGGPWPRPVNLDPGYVAADKVVLASAKNHQHRIYIGRGMYAEATLFWRGGGFVSLPWTFPDFASGLYDDFFRAARERLLARRRTTR